MLSQQRTQFLESLLARRVVQHALAVTALTAFCSLLFFYRLADRALWSSHEGRAGQHAQLMLDGGGWCMPTLYFGESDYQKPPLYYWWVAGAAWWRGGDVDEWSVRLPAAISALVTVWLVYALGSVAWRPSAGVIAGLVVSCNLRFCWLARVGRIDMPLTLAVTAVLASFWMAYRRSTGFASERAMRGWGWMLVAYLAASAAVMFKGPVGLVLPLVSIVAFLAIERQPIWPWRREWLNLAHRLGVWWGLPLVLVIAGPWFVWASVVTRGEFLKVFFLHHNLDRTLGVDGLKPEPFWYYVPQLVVDLFPWSVLLPAAAIASLRRRSDAGNCPLRFFASAFVAMFVLLSVVRFKRHDYLLPLVPCLALMVAGHLTRLVDAAGERAGWFGAKLVGGLTCAVVAATAAATPLIRSEDLARRALDSRLIRHLVHDTDRMILSGLAESLRPANAAVIAVSLALCLVAGAFVAAVNRRRIVAAVTLISVAWSAAFLVAVNAVLPVLEPLREQRSLARLAREIQPAGATVHYYGREDQQLMFYLGPGTKWLTGREMFRPVITQSEPAFVLVELDRLQQRLKDCPDVRMVPIARNDENSFGTHRDPVVLVTNDAGWRLVQSRRAARRPLAN